MTTCGVYQITNKINGKSYIGASINIEKRWEQHRADSYGSTPLADAFRYYGVKNFVFKILAECKAEELVDMKQMYMDNLGCEYNVKATATRGSHKSKGYRAWKLDL